MSKSITITGIYRNNKRNTVGLYDPANIDMVNIQFDANDLITKTAKYFANKVFKRFEVNINVSSSNNDSERRTYDLKSINDNYIKQAITTINTLESRGG